MPKKLTILKKMDQGYTEQIQNSLPHKFKFFIFLFDNLIPMQKNKTNIS